MGRKLKSAHRQFIFRMTNSEWDILKTFAKSKGVTRTDVVRQSVETYLKANNVVFEDKAVVVDPNQLRIDGTPF
jgi:uncharacterized protein (DUF1778 family)